MEGVGSVAAPLTGEIDADVAIIGAGFTGLSTAIALRAAGHSVVVLEQAHVGYGASGRNAGHLTPVIGKDLPTLALLFRRRARPLIELVELAIGHVERTIVQRSTSHSRSATCSPPSTEAARDADEGGCRGDALGLDSEVLELEAAPATCRQASRVAPRGAAAFSIRPLYGAASSRRRRAPASSRTRLWIDEGSPALVTTSGGRSRARHRLATSASRRIRWLLGTIARFRLPVRDRSARRNGGRRSAGGRKASTRRTRCSRATDDDDQRIVGGAKTVRYGFDGRALADDPATFAFIERAFRDRFPALRDLAITHRWGGPIAFALDFLPAVGVTGTYRNVYYSAGYAGHGIAMGSYAGTMIADLMLGREGPGHALWGHWKVPMPPEPLRWLVAKGLVAAFGAVDGRVDRLVGRQ
jgi:glycine/D-amino acid oxidase-like deaminating enzyme